MNRVRKQNPNEWTIKTGKRETTKTSKGETIETGKWEITETSKIKVTTTSTAKNIHVVYISMYTGWEYPDSEKKIFKS